jgi:hypothetical protein
MISMIVAVARRGERQTGTKQKNNILLDGWIIA